MTSFDDYDDEEEEEHATTPRKDLKRWRPSASATTRTYDRSTRYASEPPSMPDSHVSLDIHTGRGVERTRRSSQGLVRHEGDLDLEPKEKIEMWRSGRESSINNRAGATAESRKMLSRTRAALPSEFRNDFVSSFLCSASSTCVSVCARDLTMFARTELLSGCA